MNSLLQKIKKCTLCSKHLPLHPKPILSFDLSAKILIVGQAPGRKAHDSGIPWNDASGDRLRQWLGLEKQHFYNPKIVTIVPMGFCFPGTGKSGDLPPRQECSETWMKPVLEKLKKIELKLIIGSYAQDYFIKESKNTLTETVRAWKSFGHHLIPLPHPSPRNNIWLRKNPWFEKDLLPVVRRKISKLIDN